MAAARCGRRVVVVHAGEASAELALRWAQAGDLPNLRRMAERGVGGSLTAAEPFVTAQMVGTMYTSREPGEHGLFDFWQRGPDGAFRAVGGQDLKAPPFWRMVEQAGLRCGLINLPFTYPPEPLSGFVLSGSDAPGAHRSIAHPPALFDELTARFGPYPLKDIYPGGRDKEDYLTLVERDGSRWVEIVGHLAASQNWDVLVCYVGATAMAQHYFWGDMAEAGPDDPYRDVVRAAFRTVDRMVGRLRDVAGPEVDLFVVSECGSGPLVGGVDVNAFLAREGFLAFAEARVSTSGAASRGLLDRARYLAQRHLPASVKTAILHRLAPAKTWLQNRFDSSGIDWSRTRAFSRGEEGQIFVNLRGRDPYGIVAPGAEFDMVCEQIIAGLLALRDPRSGEAAVTGAFRANQAYPGPMRDHAPDIVVHWHNGEYMPNESVERGDEVFGERWREGMSWPTTGSHRPDAIFFAEGPSVAVGSAPRDGRIADLVPTWLHCLGLAPPPELEGRVLDEILHHEPAKRRLAPMES